MKLFSLLFFISIFSFAQEIDTINLKEVALVDYSKYKQFRPKYKRLDFVKNNVKEGLQLFSNFQLPKQNEVEIIAIEILFEAKKKNFVLCGDSFYMKLKIVKELNPNINLIEDKWFEVNKDYQGKYIFPVNLKLKKSEINDYLLGIESVNETTNCQNNFFSYDLIKTKEVQYYYAYPSRNDIKIVKSELFNHYSLNYKIYYK